MPKKVLVGLISKVKHPVTIKFKNSDEQFILAHKQRTKKEFVEADLIYDPSEVMIYK